MKNKIKGLVIAQSTGIGKTYRLVNRLTFNKAKELNPTIIHIDLGLAEKRVFEELGGKNVRK